MRNSPMYKDIIVKKTTYINERIKRENPQEYKSLSEFMDTFLQGLWKEYDYESGARTMLFKRNFDGVEYLVAHYGDELTIPEYTSRLALLIEDGVVKEVYQHSISKSNCYKDEIMDELIGFKLD